MKKLVSSQKIILGYFRAFWSRNALIEPATAPNKSGEFRKIQSTYVALCTDNVIIVGVRQTTNKEPKR